VRQTRRINILCRLRSRPGSDDANRKSGSSRSGRGGPLPDNRPAERRHHSRFTMLPPRVTGVPWLQPLARWRWSLPYGSSGGVSCRGTSSRSTSSGVGSVVGGTGVLFSIALRLRPLGLLRATFFRAAVLRPAVMRVAVLRAAVFLRVAGLRTADVRAVVFRAAVLRAAVLRPAVLRAAVLRPAVLRAADLRATDLRAAVLRVADLRRVVFRAAAVLRGRPGLRLLGMNSSFCFSRREHDAYCTSCTTNIDHG